MKIEWIDYNEVAQLSKRDRDFINRKQALKPFVGKWTSLEAIEDAIEERKKYPINREVLYKQLLQQYENISVSEKTKENIVLLKQENSFTVTTAHQLNLMGGPLYVIYKIASVLNLSKQLSLQYPNYNIIPVYIVGGEDHDLEEINHMYLFGKTIQWKNDETGSTGKMSTNGLEDVLKELKVLFGNQFEGHEFFDTLDKFLAESSTYLDFVTRFINELFGQYGLVILNASDKEFKKEFTTIFKDDILHKKSKKLVDETIEALKKEGYKAQASPRDINTFYLGDGMRERIVQEDEYYKVNNTDIRFTSSEISQELDKKPQRFSPNVILRPLYQESILPNLAYIGGGGEIAYWTERKAQFAAHKVFFPLLVRRNSVLQISKSNQKSMEKLDLTTDQLFETEHTLINAYVKRNSANTLDIEKEINSINGIYDNIANKAKGIQMSLEKAVLAEKAKQLKVLKGLESKLLKFEKDKYEVGTNRIKRLKESLFPHSGLQERYDNFLPHYLKYGDAYLDYLVNNLSPLNSKFAVIEE